MKNTNRINPTIPYILLITGLVLSLSSCSLFDSGHHHIHAYGYELETGGVVIARYEAGPGTFQIPEETDFNYNGKLAISSGVLDQEGYSEIVSIHFLDKEGNRKNIAKYKDDGEDGEWLLGWNNQADQRLQLNALALEKVENETWKFRFHTEQRGDTAAEKAGMVAFEVWHIDHSDFTAGGLELYVLTEYEQ